MQRGRIPIVVGGTGFYLRWYVHGPPSTPRSAPDAQDRAQALLNQAWGEAETAKGAPLSPSERWEEATALVARLGDPAAAAKCVCPPPSGHALSMGYLYNSCPIRYVTL